MKVKQLRDAYKARKNDQDALVVDGYAFVPDYLKYLLEYLKSAKDKDEIELTKGVEDG